MGGREGYSIISCVWNPRALYACKMNRSSSPFHRDRGTVVTVASTNPSLNAGVQVRSGTPRLCQRTCARPVQAFGQAIGRSQELTPGKDTDLGPVVDPCSDDSEHRLGHDAWGLGSRYGIEDQQWLKLRSLWG